LGIKVLPNKAASGFLSTIGSQPRKSRCQPIKTPQHIVCAQLFFQRETIVEKLFIPNKITFTKQQLANTHQHPKIKIHKVVAF
jgi:hypothetical protein